MRVPGSIGTAFTVIAAAIIASGSLWLAARSSVAPATAADHADQEASLAAFAEVASVLKSPRCQNCHTQDDFPRQGDDRHPHAINVHRGPEGRGAIGMPCSACHTRANYDVVGLPGAADDWRLAPLSMGWADATPGELCRDLLDPAKNGGRSGEAVLDHLHTPLVDWGWKPGRDRHGTERSVPPISQAAFVAAAEHWLAAGAACPDR